MKTKQDLIDGYKKDAQTYRNAIFAWRGVERKTKKDGTDFANIERNFVNARIKNEYPWSPTQVLSVNYRYGYGGGYTDDKIEVANDDTVDSLFDKIEERIKEYNSRIEECEKHASNVERVFSEVDSTMKQLLKFCNDNDFSPYTVCDYIGQNCWRL